MRLLLANYFSPESEVDFNRLSVGMMASDRGLFDEWSVIDSSDLPEADLIDGRSDLFRVIARSAPSPVYFKTHDAWTMSASGCSVFPSDATLAVVYLVRHPFDVAVSMSHFFDWSLDKVVGLMCNDAFSFRRDPVGISAYFPQPVRSWHRNVSSWIDDSRLPLALVRYEDLRNDTANVLTRVLRTVGEPVDAARVSRAVSLTTFERLQAEERRRGFRERVATAQAFFRAGRLGDGFRELSPAQQDVLTSQQGSMMRRLGYL